jgi:hypothetical protein
MKLKTVKSKKARKVIDVNGQEQKSADCIARVVGGFNEETLKEEYFPIISPDTRPEDGFQYAIDFGRGIGIHLSLFDDIVWIEMLGTWVMLQPGQEMVEVIYYDEDYNLKSGSSLYDPYVTVKAYDKTGKLVNIINHDTAIKMGFVPSKSANEYHSPSLKSHKRDLYSSLNTKHSFNLPIQTNHHADESNDCFNRVVDIFAKTDLEVTSKETRYMNKLLGGKSFGIEYEVVGGTIPSPMLGPLGVTALTDGSIGRSNYEITTVPLEGVKGLEAVKLQCEALTNQAKINANCALHIHIGNVANDKLTFISLYALMHRLQSEIYACHPYYKQHEIAIMGKGKEYSRALPEMGLKRNKIFNSSTSEEFNNEVNKWHSKLFKYFACTEESAEYNRGKRKKANANTRTLWGAKWHCPTRYYWANFINYLFSKSGTIEFRVHEPTTNFTKVSAFLLLCSTLIRYAERYPERILAYDKKITLEDVIDELRTNFTDSNPKGKFGVYCNEVADWMLSYIERREEFFRHQVEVANNDAAVNHRNSFGVIGSIMKSMFKVDAKWGHNCNGRHFLY